MENRRYLKPTKEIGIIASGIELCENGAEQFGRNLSAALRKGRRGGLNASDMQNLI